MEVATTLEASTPCFKKIFYRKFEKSGVGGKSLCQRDTSSGNTLDTAALSSGQMWPGPPSLAEFHTSGQGTFGHLGVNQWKNLLTFCITESHEWGWWMNSTTLWVGTFDHWLWKLEIHWFPVPVQSNVPSSSLCQVGRNIGVNIWSRVHFVIRSRRRKRLWHTWGHGGRLTWPKTSAKFKDGSAVKLVEGTDVLRP